MTLTVALYGQEMEGCLRFLVLSCLVLAWLVRVTIDGLDEVQLS